MMKTLYISDLDGTLLQSDQRISRTSCEIINSLIRDGMCFSYATARSLNTARTVTAGLDAKFPVILHNGTFIIDGSTSKRLISNSFTDDEALEIYTSLISGGVFPLVYALRNDAEKFSYDSRSVGRGIGGFLLTRATDPRRNPLKTDNGILDGEKYYFTCIDDRDKLQPLYDLLKDRFNCLFQKDIYSGEYWLEILPHHATKANAALQLKALLGCDRIVSFGDSLNDLPLAEISDEFYAVANAHPQVKATATSTINTNNQNSVALTLKKLYRQK